MKVLVNIVFKQYDKDAIFTMSERCRSNNHDVTVNLCDYSLDKQAEKEISEIDSDGFNQRILNLNFEDISEHDKNLTQIAKQEYDVVIDLQPSVEVEKNFLDEMELETFQDKNYGCLYTDFFSKTKNNYKIYVHQKSFPISNNSLPLVAFAFNAYKDKINNGDQNPKGSILSSMVSKHIKKALCSIGNV